MEKMSHAVKMRMQTLSEQVFRAI